MNQWETQPDGTVVVNGQVPTLTGQALADLHTELRMMGEIVGAKAQEYGYPFPAAMGTLHAEGVIPVARNRHIPEDDAWTIESFDHGLGWYQVTSAGLKKDKSGRLLSRDEVLDPETNADIGVRYLTLLRGMYGGDWFAPQQGLPRVAAAFNAGSARPGNNEWNLHTYRPNYVDEVVAANNTVIALGLGEGPSGGGKTSTGDKLIRLGCSLLAALGLGYTLARVMR